MHTFNIFRILDAGSEWQLGVGAQGAVIAILQDASLEVRAKKDEYASVVGKNLNCKYVILLALNPFIYYLLFIISLDYFIKLRSLYLFLMIQIHRYPTCLGINIPNICKFKFNLAIYT